MARINSPITWYGGKSYMLNNLLPILEDVPHDIYVETCGGGGVVIINKKPKPVEVFNDLDNGVYNFFKVLSDPILFRQFYRKIKFLPYHRTLYNECRKTWNEQGDSVEMAWRWFVVARMSFAGYFAHSFGTNVTKSNGGRAETANKWRNTKKRLRVISERLLRVQFENQDVFTILDRYDTPNTLFYIDPPYVQTERHGKEKYLTDMSNERHQEMVALLLTRQGKVVLSAYEHPVYQPLLNAGYEMRKFSVTSHAAARTRSSGLQGVGNVTAQQQRTECVYIKPYVTLKTQGDSAASGQETLF